MNKIVAVASVAVVILIVGLVIVAQPRQSTKSSTLSTKESSKVNPAAKLEGTKLANFTPVEKIDSLQKIDTINGTGAEVASGANVTVHYTGALASTGVIFQSSKDSGAPISFPLSGVIAGWTQGVPGMKVGGTRRLLIPSELAYGSSAQSGIPANSDLVFDIEMISTK